VHDLAVLWQTAIRIRAFQTPGAHAEWRSRIEQERRERLDTYRKKMMGNHSLWPVWRDDLPREEQVRSLGLQRLRIWASFLDPDVKHSEHVARLARQIYSGLPDKDLQRRNGQWQKYRDVLEAAALMHEVGRSKSSRGHHKTSGRLIRKLMPPAGWTADEIRTVALVARYHRGALPRDTQAQFARTARSKQRIVVLLGGVLRLACACDWQHDGLIRGLAQFSSGPVLTFRAEGYTEYTALAEHLAAARHLLEVAVGYPVLILPVQQVSAA